MPSDQPQKPLSKLRASLKFFFYILRLCGLNAIDLRQTPLQVSRFWTLHTLSVLIGYGYFHMATVQVDLKTPAEGVNFVTALIDYYNKYSNLVLFVTSLLVTLVHQSRLIEFINVLETHDLLFESMPSQLHINYGKQKR